MSTTLTELSKKTIPQLKDMLKERELPVGGLKEDLMKRLLKYDLAMELMAPRKEKIRSGSSKKSTSKAAAAATQVSAATVSSQVESMQKDLMKAVKSLKSQMDMQLQAMQRQLAQIGGEIVLIKNKIK